MSDKPAIDRAELKRLCAEAQEPTEFSVAYNASQRFRAACGPAVVSALLAELEAVEAENAQLKNGGALKALRNISAAKDAEIERLTDWQPIETAPKDALIDIWISRPDGSGLRWADCYHDSICNEWRTSRPSGNLLSIRAKHVTHWRHTPSPPRIRTALSEAPGTAQAGMISAERACEIIGALIENAAATDDLGAKVRPWDIREAINTIRMEVTRSAPPAITGEE